jgi:hypothetical protein
MMTSDLDKASDEQEESVKQTLSRAISLEIIEQLDPSQLDATDVVIDDLIDLAEQGRILPRGAESAFGFGGLDLIAQFVVPAVVAALTVLTIRHPRADTPTSDHRHGDRIFLTEQQLAEIVQRADFTISSRQIQEITRLINMLVNRYLESGGAANYQPSPADIDSQRERLEAHRQTLKVFLDRQAMVGKPNITPEIHHGMNHARAEIQRIKDTLRSWGVNVDNHADDEPAA